MIGPGLVLLQLAPSLALPQLAGETPMAIEQLAPAHVSPRPEQLFRPGMTLAPVAPAQRPSSRVEAVSGVDRCDPATRAPLDVCRHPIEARAEEFAPPPATDLSPLATSDLFADTLSADEAARTLGAGRVEGSLSAQAVGLQFQRGAAPPPPPSGWRSLAALLASFGLGERR